MQARNLRLLIQEAEKQMNPALQEWDRLNFLLARANASFLPSQKVRFGEADEFYIQALLWDDLLSLTHYVLKSPSGELFTVSNSRLLHPLGRPPKADLLLQLLHSGEVVQYPLGTHPKLFSDLSAQMDGIWFKNRPQWVPAPWGQTPIFSGSDDKLQILQQSIRAQRISKNAALMTGVSDAWIEPDEIEVF